MATSHGKILGLVPHDHRVAAMGLVRRDRAVHVDLKRAAGAMFVVPD